MGSADTGTSLPLPAAFMAGWLQVWEGITPGLSAQYQPGKEPVSVFPAPFRPATARYGPRAP